VETPETSFEKERSERLPETVSVRGMTPAIPQQLADQLLPPIDKAQRKEWERLQREKQDQQD
jgi:hypothetical protein